MLPIPGLDPGTVDPSEAAFASGMLAGAGLREISQTLGLSRKRGGAGKTNGAMPAAATMMGGNLGEVDKLMLLARLQSMAGGGGAAGPMDPMAALGPGGGMPPGMPPGVGPLPMPPGAGPLLLPPGAGPILPPGLPPMSPQPPLANPGGALPLQLLLQMLSGTGGMV